MHRNYFSVFLVFLLILFCLPLSGCGTVEEEYKAFYESLVNEDGNFRFRGTNPGDSQDTILQAEGLEGIVDQDITFMDATGLFRCNTPVQFPCFDFVFSREYWMERNGENALLGGCYDASFYREEDWVAACGQIIDFVKARFPEGDSFEKLEQLPEPDQAMSPQWSIEAPDGSSLSVTFQNKNAPAHPLAHPASCRIRFDITYK